MPKIESEHTDTTWMRIDEIIIMILENDLAFHKDYHNELVETIKEKYGIENAAAYRLIAEAKKKVKKLKSEITKKSVESHFAKAILDREWVIRESKIQKDIGKALDGMKDREKLLDLYPNQKLETENINYDIDLSKLTEKGLERIKRGDDPRVVLLDPESVKIEK